MSVHLLHDPQRTAADPQVSAFVRANAGSGKTKTLIDRVARLLLDGAKPETMMGLSGLGDQAYQASPSARLGRATPKAKTQPTAILAEIRMLFSFFNLSIAANRSRVGSRSTSRKPV